MLVPLHKPRVKVPLLLLVNLVHNCKLPVKQPKIDQANEGLIKMDGSLDGHIISDMELDHILRALKPSDLEDIGGKTWIQQMSMLEELNVQAALEARDGLEERVRDSLVEHDKLGLVVRDMILVEIWREEIMPRILREGQPESSFQVSCEWKTQLFYARGVH